MKSLSKAPKKEKGINVTVSPKAHDLLLKKGMANSPKKNLRKVVNIIVNLPEEA